MGSCFSKKNNSEKVDLTQLSIISNPQKSPVSVKPIMIPDAASNQTALRRDMSKLGDLPQNFEVGKVLAEVPLLRSLTADDRAKLGAAFVECPYEDGTPVVCEGDIGEEFFVIKEGIAVVSMKNKSGVNEEIATLSTNDYFGEMALVRNETRAATITAKGQLTCFTLDKCSFEKMFGGKGLNVMFAKR
eukprot:897008_1